MHNYIAELEPESLQFDSRVCDLNHCIILAIYLRELLAHIYKHT